MACLVKEVHLLVGVAVVLLDKHLMLVLLVMVVHLQYLELLVMVNCMLVFVA